MKQLLVLLVLLPAFASGQSKVMRNLADDYPDARALMFYHSSLRMLNLEDDPAFDAMIRDIEKIKVLIVEKADNDSGTPAISQLKSDLSEYGYEELMTVRSKDFDVGVYINEDDGDIEGYFFVMDEEESFIAVDLVGNMPVGDVGKLIDIIQEANDF